MTAIVDIEGIGETYAVKLKAAGVNTVEELLKVGAAPKGRKELEEKTGISGKSILEWVNRADLARIKGVGSEYADLLEAAGVDTVVELGTRKPENLFKKMEEINAEKKLVRKMPTEAQIAGWVDQAKKLDRVVTY
jgi:predicted flap endonuclease-1-like 5' DNA nuclease